MDLMHIMMQKIKRTEARCAIFENESKEKDITIVTLRRQIEAMKNGNYRLNKSGLY